MSLSKRLEFLQPFLLEDCLADFHNWRRKQKYRNFYIRRLTFYMGPEEHPNTKCSMDSQWTQGFYGVSSSPVVHRPQEDEA